MSFKKKANASESDSDEFELGPDAEDEDESIAADTVPESVSEEEEAPGWSVIPSTILKMESEDEEKDSKAAPAPTIEGEVPCASPPVDEDIERSNRIKIICDPMTTSMKIPTTSDEDIASLFLSSSVAAQSDAPPKQLQQ